MHPATQVDSRPILSRRCFLSFPRQFIFPSTRFLLGFELPLPYPLSSWSITWLEACQGESYLEPCIFLCFSACVFLFPQCGFFVFRAPSVGLYCSQSKYGVFTCLCVCVRTAGRRVPSCVPLDKAIHASPRTSPRSRGPNKMPDRGAERVLLTNICSHCELLARYTHSRRGEKHAWQTRVHTQTCRNRTPRRD